MRKVCRLKITYPTDHSRWAVCEWYPNIFSFISILWYAHNIKGTLRLQQVGGVWKIPPKVSCYALCNILRGSQRASRSAAKACILKGRNVIMEEFFAILKDSLITITVKDLWLFMYLPQMVILEFDSWSHFVAVKILVIMNIEYIA